MNAAPGPAGASGPDRAGARGARPRDRRCMSGPGEEVAEVRDARGARARRRRSRSGSSAREARSRAARRSSPTSTAAAGRSARSTPSTRSAARWPTRRALIVASVDYRLAPEHPFPAAARRRAAPRCAGWPSTRTSSAPTRRGSAIAGDSAGGNLATVTARRLRDERRPAAALPGADLPGLPTARSNTPSYREKSDGLRAQRGEHEALLGPLSRRRRRPPARRLAAPGRRPRRAAARVRPDGRRTTSCATRARPTRGRSRRPACR